MWNKFIVIFILVIGGELFGQNKEYVRDPNSADEDVWVIDKAPKPFYFEKDSDEYQYIEYLQKVASTLLKHDVSKIILVGHCTNQELRTVPNLSLNRAKAIKLLLIEMGFPKSRIEIEDQKADKPSENSSNDDKDRRVEWLVLLDH